MAFSQAHLQHPLQGEPRLVDTAAAAAAIHTTGSFTGYRPLARLGSSYLESVSSPSPEAPVHQKFCANEEGWGPISPFRYDFTPCFVDVWVATVSVFGIVCGAAALIWMLRNRPPTTNIKKDWHFWLKQTLLAAVIADFLVQLGFQIHAYGDLWFDFRVLTTVLTVVSLAVVFAIQWLEHARLRTANGVALFYWLFLVVALAVKLRSLISQQTYVHDDGYFVVYCVGLAVGAVAFLVEWLHPRRKSPYDATLHDDKEECPAEYATIFSLMTFSWITPLMKLGYKTYLGEENLWALRKSDRTGDAGEAFQHAWDHQMKVRPANPSLTLALTGAYGGPFALAALFKIANDIAKFQAPLLLRYLIDFVDSYYTGETPQPVIWGVALAVGMFVASLAETIFISHYFQLTMVAGMRIKAGLVSAIYRKSMKLSNEGRSVMNTGDIVNHMAIDTSRLMDVTQWAHQLWSAPLQIIICMVLLYNLVGWSMMAGIAVMIISMPAQGLVAQISKRLQKQQMKNKDARTRLIAEIINNMKSIKLYSWGAAFMSKLSHVRNDQELKNLRKIGATQAFANFVWTTAPFFVSCSTFGVFVLTGDKPLTADIVFPALALFNLLSFPLAVLPMVISALVEASVAVTRLNKFLTAEEIQPDAVAAGPTPTKLGDESVVVRRADFSWNRHEDKTVLRDIDFTAYKGELSCIIGRVGAGKSSMLQSLLGDLWKAKGEVRVNGSVAYVAQQAWVLNATVKENVVFGHRFDPDFYRRTVEACALIDDFDSLPDGDGTVVGERGISLSGGQKARLSLARAVYARADIYLLDDVLSAVDSHVGKHIIENVLGPRGLLASKTRVLATNAIAVLKQATYITMLKDGVIIERGTYRDLMAAGDQVAEMVRATIRDQSNSSGESSETSTMIGTEPPPNLSPAAQEDGNGNGNGNGIENEYAIDDGPETAPIKPGPILLDSKRGRTGSMTTLRRASAASFRGPRGKLTDDEVNVSARTKQVKEHQEQGKVKWDVYVDYARHNRYSAVVVYILVLLAAQTGNIAGSFWLKEWADSNQKSGTNEGIAKYLGIYFAFGIGAAVLTMVQSLVLWIFCSIEASKKFHEKMANAIFRSPMSFFDTTPAGRILNRFSSDIYRIDEVLARTFNMLFNNLGLSIATLAVITISTPSFVILILPLSLAYYWIQRYYLRTSRELKRLDSVTKSPIYAHFQESLGGISTIRAFRQQHRFTLENEWRMDAQQRAYFPSITANRWLALRLEFLGAVVILGAAGLSIVSVISGSGLSSGLVGLAMSYALQITRSLNWIVRQTVEVETNIVAVERVLEYARLPSEAPEIIPERRPAASWPTRGAVRFNNFSTRYRENLDLVLKNISLDIKSHEKIGVVGRTGAGKSSLTLSLFRIIEPTEGHIAIDDVNTSEIGLLDLRRRLAIIPQDAALFEGTLRDNLDPGHVHEDTELWSVLEHARLKDHITSMDGGLEARVNEGGSNLSQGQRQLVSLARAMLTPSNILILDEATASVDVQTDALVQETLRSQLFANRTIITIAHRINSILDSDRVVVLDRGQVVEFDTPAALMAKKGMFYGLAKQAGIDSAE